MVGRPSGSLGGSLGAVIVGRLLHQDVLVEKRFDGTIEVVDGLLLAPTMPFPFVKVVDMRRAGTLQCGHDVI